MDYYYETVESLFLQPPRESRGGFLRRALQTLLTREGVCQSKMSEDEDYEIFDPELVIAHCFKQFKRKDLHLPESRRRIIILPQEREQVPRDPRLQPPAPPQPIPCFKALEAADVQEQPEDSMTWLNHRLKLRRELESLGNIKRWLGNKPSVTPSEARVFRTIHQEHTAQLDHKLHAIRATRKKVLRVSHRSVPQLRLPKPPALSDMYSYLRSRKVKILELFHKAEQSESQKISREEFIATVKAVGVPLSNQEVEDIVIYLGSLGKHNTITMENLANTYKQWSLAHQRSVLPTPQEYYTLAKQKSSRKSSASKQEEDSTPQTPQMDFLTVPEVDTQMEARPMTLEDMEDVGKRYRERRRQHKFAVPSIQYLERCRLVRCGKKQFDEHCLPSTIHGDTEEFINAARRDAFLVYLQCWRLCEAYGLPLTEDTLMRALLYPGDMIIFQKNQVRPIRQPGGYYSDWKSFTPRLARSWGQDLRKSGAKNTDKKGFKKMRFKDFEEFSRRLKKRPSGSQRTHPNAFWPGHLLDKLRLYLPTVAKDRSLALFSCVQKEHQAYPAVYHPYHWWPLKETSYMTRAEYDSTKVYHIN